MKEFWGLRILLVMLYIALPHYAFTKDNNDLLQSLSKKEGGANTLYIENKGQIGDQNGKPNTSVKYLILRPGLNIQLKANSFSYDAYTVERFKRVERLVEPLHSKFDKHNDDSLVYHFSRVDIELVDANPNPQITQEGSSSDYLNYYTHITSQTHGEEGVTGIKGYSTITYHDIYPNIDLEWFLDKDGKPEYQFIINPGGDPSRIRLKYHGAKKTELISDAIHIHIKPGIIKEHIPLSYLKESKEKLTIAFTKISSDEYGFNIPTYASYETLIIDPMPNRLWGTYYGGNNSEIGHSLAIDNSGNNIFLTGETGSNSEIASNGAFDVSYCGLGDAFITKFSNVGKRVWATYFGGPSTDIGFAITFYADSTLKIYVTGKTYSNSDISTSGAWDTLYGGNVEDAFLVKFSSSGTRIWGTYFGGSSQDLGQAVTCDINGNVYIAGETKSNLYIATSGAWIVSLNASIDLFLAKFTPNGNLLWSTYHGGNGGGVQTDPANFHARLISDNSGNVFLAGSTNCPAGIASKGAWNEKIGIDGYQYLLTDIFLSKFSSSGSKIWGTYFGGEGQESDPSIAIDKLGNIFLAGYTTSTEDIVSFNAHDTSYSGNSDVFISKFSNNGLLLWATYFGGTKLERLGGISNDSIGDVYLAGITSSDSEIATFDAWDQTLNGTEDCFIAKFSSSGKKVWSSYYGGEGKERATSILTDNYNNFYVTGYTNSASDLYSEEAWDALLNGTQDVFLAKFNNGFIKTISKPVITKNIYCANDSIEVSFTANGFFSSTNIFFVQLSDSTGIFNKPIVIGSLLSDSSGIIRCSIPLNSATGFNYRIRILSSDSTVISEDNGFNITIFSLSSPSIIGPQIVCSGNQIYNYGITLVPGNSYYWQKPVKGVIIGTNSGNSLKIRWIDGGIDSLKVIQTNNLTGCNKDTTIIIKINSNPNISIDGNTNVCSSIKSERYSTIELSEIKFQWLAPLRGSIVGNSNKSLIDVIWSVIGIDSLKLKATNMRTGCITDTFIVVTVLPQPLPIITGNSDALEQDKGLVYSVQPENGSTYEWVIVSGDATITTKSGQLVVVNVGAKGAVILKVIQTNKDGCTNEAQFVINVKSVSGIKESTQSAFSIYPNPTGDANQIMLQFSEAQKQQIDVELLDILGNQMYMSSINIGDQSTTIPIHNLCSGMYMIRVRMNNEVYMEKVIVN